MKQEHVALLTLLIGAAGFGAGRVSQPAPPARPAATETPAPAAPSTPAQPAAQIDFTESDRLVARVTKDAGSGTGTASVSFALKSQDTAKRIVKFALVMFDTLGVEQRLTPRPDSVTVPPFGVAAVRLQVQLDSGAMHTTHRGLLVMEVGAGAARKTRALEIAAPLDRPQVLGRGAADLLVLGGAAAGGALVLVGLLWSGVGSRLLAPMAMASYDMSQSWASNLAVLIAVGGALLTSTAFPTAPFWMERTQYTAVTLLLGAMVTLAPAAFSLLRVPKKVPTTATQPSAEFRGLVAGFLAASLLVLWAVVGQLGVAWLVADEYARAKVLPPSAATSLKVLVYALLGALAWYSARTIATVVKTSVADADAEKVATPTTPHPTQKSDAGRATEDHEIPKSRGASREIGVPDSAERVVPARSWPML